MLNQRLLTALVGGFISVAALTLNPSTLASAPKPMPVFIGAAADHDPAQLATLGSLAAQAAQVLNVAAVDIQPVDINGAPGVATTATLSIDNQPATLLLVPFTVRAPGFKLSVQQGGAMIDTDPGQFRTMRGEIAEIPGSIVAASLFDEGLFARILLPDGRQFWVEPLALRLPDAQFADHAVYQNESILPSGGVCATPDGPFIPGEGDLEGERPDTERGGPCGANFCIAQVACDADRDFFISQASSVPQTVSRIESILNSVNIQYERDVFIRHTITQIIVRTDDSNPYNTNDAGGLLSQVASEWINNLPGVTRDVTHMFTGRDLSGSTIGVAYLGGICNNGSTAYGLVQSSCCGSFGCSTDLSAHELGHNWNAGHCSCTQFTMNPSLVCRNRFNSTSINQIVPFRNSRGCLAPDILPPPPSEFAILLPADGAQIEITNPLLDWAVSPGAVAYRVEWATEPSLTGAAIFQVGVSQLQTSNNTFQRGETYYWRVTAVDQYGQQTSSTPLTSSFTVIDDNPPPPPECTGDANGDNQVDGADLSILLAQFGSAVTPDTGADFNGDGLVNGADLSTFLSLFGTTCDNN